MAHATVSVKAANAGANDPGASETREAANHVHNTAAGEVNGAHIEEEVLVGTEGRRPAGGGPHPCR